MKTALVIGAGGFIGRYVCRALLQAGYSVTAADIHQPAPSALSTSQFKHIQLDITKVVDFNDLIADTDLVVYLACTLLPQTSNERPVYDVQSNLVPVVALLEAIRFSNRTRLVFASSGGTVYGEMQQSPMPETHQTTPLCSYGIVKLTTEKYIHMYRNLYGVKAVSLRISNPFGVGQNPLRPQGAVGVFLNSIKQNNSIKIWGDGTLIRDYIWVEDVANAFVAAATYEGSYSVFNIATGVGSSLNELLSHLFAITDHTVAVEYLPSRAFDVAANTLSIELAKSELEWSPQISLVQGITSMCQA